MKTIKMILVSAILIISLFGVFYSSYNIIKYKIDQNKIESQIKIIETKIIYEEIKDNPETEVIVQEEEIPEANPYWDYIKMNLIDVDFNDLKKLNNNVKGWIKVNGTNINYPFVQTNDNSFYLKHSFNKSNNSAGWVFLDYRNDLSNSNDKNTILYAHGRLDKTMFGSLKNILSSDWLSNSNNYIVKLSTEYENTLWQVFSIYTIPTTSDYIQVNFADEEEFEDFASMIKNRSEYNFDCDISPSDRILTLSTCYNETDKVVLHAKLIKREQKTN